MLAGIEETNQVARMLIYEELQRYFVEDLPPWAFFTPQKTTKHGKWT
ncbi:MAG: hypothetical protein ACFFG0_45955 [Candidatus Thorarchaeota archaeon]